MKQVAVQDRPRHRRNLEVLFVRDIHPLSPAQVRVWDGQAEVTADSDVLDDPADPAAETARQALESACFNAAQSISLHLWGPVEAAFRLRPHLPTRVRAVGRVQGEGPEGSVLCRGLLLDEDGRRVGVCNMTFRPVPEGKPEIRQAALAHH